MENEKIYVTARCPIRTTMELIGGKWKLLIIQQLLNNTVLRLSELKKLIPDVSEKMLIQELQALVESGLVRRKDYQEKPPKVEYSLSEEGHAVKPLIHEMVRFAQQYEQSLLKD